MRAAYDDSPSTAGQKKPSEQLSRHRRGRRRRLRASRLQLNPSVFLLDEDAKEEPTGEQEEDDEVQGGASGHERSTWKVEHKQRPEAHTDTRECAREETIDDEITEAAGHTLFHLLMIP